MERKETRCTHGGSEILLTTSKMTRSHWGLKPIDRTKSSGLFRSTNWCVQSYAGGMMFQRVGDRAENDINYLILSNIYQYIISSILIVDMVQSIIFFSSHYA